MNGLIDVSSDFEMSSLDFLNEVINPARMAAGENPIENGKFLKKLVDEIDDLPAPKIFRHDKINNLRTPDQKYYNLSMDQMLLVGMRESKAVRRSVLAKLKELSQAAAPKQEVNTSQAALDAINAINSITQAALDAIKAIQQAAVMQPVIEQHTEPVALPHVGEHHSCPTNKISLNKMKSYVSNEKLLKELISGFGLVGEMFDPGCVEGTNKKAHPYMVYDKKQVAAMLKAAQVKASKEDNGKRKLLGRSFQIGTNVSPNMYDSFDFDAACEMILLLEAEKGC